MSNHASTLLLIHVLYLHRKQDGICITYTYMYMYMNNQVHRAKGRRRERKRKKENYNNYVHVVLLSTANMYM